MSGGGKTKSFLSTKEDYHLEKCYQNDIMNVYCVLMGRGEVKARIHPSSISHHS